MRQEMGQRQLLTPRMIQSMELLQLPLMALEERIEQELDANPVLEMRDGEIDANAVTETEAQELYATFAVPGSGVPLFQAATANLNPWTEAKVDTENPDRGPLLIIDGEMDNTVPWAVANASYKRQKRNPDITEIVKIPGRGHSLTIDHGWREVADTALAFVQKHAQS